MSIEVVTVRGRRDLARFIELPHLLHAGQDCYVPQLDLLQRRLLGPGSPFRRHSELELFLARRAGRAVGRIAAIHNRPYDEHHGARQGFFGFFECEDDLEAARRLLDACRGWLARRGLRGLTGPVNPDLNTGCGIVVAGHDRRPAIFMPWNPPHYARLLAGGGLAVIKRLNAWEIRSDGVPDEVVGHAGRIRSRLEARGYRLRSLDRRLFAAETAELRAVYNEAMAGTWGHTPMTEEEFREQAAGIKLFGPPDLIKLAEHEGRIVGFIGAVPDLNEALARVPRGRLLPWGWARLLAARRRIRWSRVVMYGVRPEHRGSALASWLYLAMIEAVRARGLAGTEGSYVLEDNKPVNELSARLGGRLCKQYAIYGLPDEGEEGGHAARA